MGMILWASDAGRFINGFVGVGMEDDVFDRKGIELILWAPREGLVGFGREREASDCGRIKLMLCGDAVDGFLGAGIDREVFVGDENELMRCADDAKESVGFGMTNEKFDRGRAETELDGRIDESVPDELAGDSRGLWREELPL